MKRLLRHFFSFVFGLSSAEYCVVFTGKKRSFQFIFHLPFIDISAYSPVDTIVELPVHSANAVFEERSKTYNLIGK